MKRFLIAWVCGAFATGFGIWTIVEFILYLVKDDPFNMTSLVLTIVAFVLTIVLVISAFFSKDLN